MRIINQSVFDRWDIPDKSVQLIVTSPPYYSLRKYNIPDIVIGGEKDCKKHKFDKQIVVHDNLRFRDKNSNVVSNKNPLIFDTKSQQQGFCIHCHAWQGQHGLEPSYKLFIDHIRLWAKEAWRVLKDDGIFFLNLGDSYGTVSGSMGSSKYKDPKLSDGANNAQPKKLNINMHKCKILIPHRVAIALTEDGWILRNDLVWYRPNALPESVIDRYSKKSEYIFMFAKQPKYYFNLDAVKEDYSKIKYKKFNGLMNKKITSVSKYITSDGHTNRAGLQRESILRERRVYTVNQFQIANYIKSYLTKNVKKKLDVVFGKYRWEHWIRVDNLGASLPSPQDWFKLKEILNFDNKYDEIMTKVESYFDDGLMWQGKTKNPGDLWKANVQYFRLKSDLNTKIKQKVMNELINRGII